MGAVRRRTPRPAPVGRRGVVIAIRPRSPSSPPAAAAIADWPFAIAAAISPAPASPALLAERGPPGGLHLLGPRHPGELSHRQCWLFQWHGWPHLPPSPAISPPPRTASTAVDPVLAVLQALLSLLTHSPESPFCGEYELREDPQLSPAVQPVYSGLPGPRAGDPALGNGRGRAV